MSHLPPSPKPSVYFAAESLQATNKGIARLARLVARSLADEAADGRIHVQAAALSDPAPVDDIPLPIKACSGSRLKFVTAVQCAAIRSSAFVYDFLGMSRSHCLLPPLRRPFMTFICGIDVWEDASPHRLRWARRADTLVSISKYTRDRADSLYGGFSRAQVVWLATEQDDAGKRSPTPGTPPTATIISRIDPATYKGHNELISAWPHVVRAVPNARLLIVGDGPGRAALERQVAALPCASQIEFAGFVADSGMGDIWNRTDVFAMPSRKEGFGLVYIEAMRMGIPVLASVHDAASEINLHDVTGVNVDLDRSGDLENSLIRLLKNKPMRDTMGKAGLDRWKTEFRYSAFRQRLRPVLDSLLRAA